MPRVVGLTDTEITARQRASRLAAIARETFPHSSAKPDRTGTCVCIYIGNSVSRQLRLMFGRDLRLFVWLNDNSITIDNKRQLDYALTLASVYEAYEDSQFKVKKDYEEEPF